MKVYPVGIQTCIFYLSTRFFVHVQIIVKGTYDIGFCIFFITSFDIPIFSNFFGLGFMYLNRALKQIFQYMMLAVLALLKW